MKKYSLSTPFQKIASFLIDAFFITFYLIVFIESDTFSAFVLVFCIMTVFLAIFYTAIIFGARVVVDRARDVIVCRVVKNTIYDMRNIKEAKIEERHDGHKTKKVIALYNQIGYQIGEINPYMSHRNLPGLERICQEINGAIEEIRYRGNQA